ncbi:hypothetical protein BGX26_004477 [Mortierella sp. AD094]|nr:hypothetical protein BGX26_004477 [Mortierella sp. AD094]
MDITPSHTLPLIEDSSPPQHTLSAAKDMSRVEKQSTERYFVMRFRSKSELEEAQRDSLWPTNPVYDETLQRAYESSGAVYLVFTINFTKEFCGIARMTSDISWFPERTIFDRSRFRRRMKLQWLGRSSIPYDYITNQLHLPRYKAICRHGGELRIDIGQLIRDLILKQGSATSFKPSTTAQPLKELNSLDIACDVDPNMDKIGIDEVSKDTSDRNASDTKAFSPGHRDKLKNDSQTDGDLSIKK